MSSSTCTRSSDSCLSARAPCFLAKPDRGEIKAREYCSKSVHVSHINSAPWAQHHTSITCRSTRKKNATRQSPFVRPERRFHLRARPPHTAPPWPPAPVRPGRYPDPPRPPLRQNCLLLQTGGPLDPLAGERRRQWRSHTRSATRWR